MIDKKDCKHEKLVKAGKHYSLGRIRQILKCKDCGCTILDGDIDEQ